MRNIEFIFVTVNKNTKSNLKRKKMKKLRIDREQLVNVTMEAVREMINFDWSGWKIDVLIDEDGEIWSSAKNTNQVYPNAHVLFSVYPIEFDPEESEYADEEDFVYFTTDKLITDFEAKEIGYLAELECEFDVEF